MLQNKTFSHFFLHSARAYCLHGNSNLFRNIDVARNSSLGRGKKRLCKELHIRFSRNRSNQKPPTVSVAGWLEATLFKEIFHLGNVKQLADSHIKAVKSFLLLRYVSCAASDPDAGNREEKYIMHGKQRIICPFARIMRKISIQIGIERGLATAC